MAREICHEDWLNLCIDEERKGWRDGSAGTVQTAPVAKG